MHLTLVVGYRDRDSQRVHRCLESLKKQRMNDFRLIFVDYGSSERKDEIQSLVSKYPFVEYIYSETRGMCWNRSRALNCGVKLSDTEYTMTTDIDLIFSHDFLSAIVDRLDPKLELHSTAYSLPRNFKNFKQLEKKRSFLFPKRSKTALGLSQTAETRLLKEIRGFDESYSIYGLEDMDLRKRLEKNGVGIYWIDLIEHPVFHQWHAPYINSIEQEIPGGWINYKSIYYEENITQIRNNSDWGKVMSLDDRDALRLAQDNQKGDLTYTVLPTSTSHNLLKIAELINDMRVSQSLEINYVDQQKQFFKSSNTYRLIKNANRLAVQWKIPFKLTTDVSYEGHYLSTIHIRDMIYYLIETVSPKDYYIEYDQDKFRCIIVK